MKLVLCQEHRACWHAPDSAAKLAAVQALAWRRSCMRCVPAAGAKVGDVELPAWAADAPDFAAKLAQALESPQVSGQLHAWIDLIFGCKSQGPGAEKADNLFHYLTYDGMCAPYPLGLHA